MNQTIDRTGFTPSHGLDLVGLFDRPAAFDWLLAGLADHPPAATRRLDWARRTAYHLTSAITHWMLRVSGSQRFSTSARLTWPLNWRLRFGLYLLIILMLAASRWTPIARGTPDRADTSQII